MDELSTHQNDNVGWHLVRQVPGTVRRCPPRTTDSPAIASSPPSCGGRIESGAIPAGTLLPAESALTAEFRASRGTIRQAIAALREDGLATTEHGRGTYANSHSGPAGNAEPRQREVAADPQLAALFDVEVGTSLIERESITRTEGRVETVMRVYRLHQASL
ncbi:GntR family transcriptional regulator [Micromonospora sp. NPDC049900]|uniref:GntR family transcriptional regulator n=1 Tax=Micromonospora sp. NPDC049900 TaxID=3364275 RepID=UPI0037B62BBF